MKNNKNRIYNNLILLIYGIFIQINIYIYQYNIICTNIIKN